MRKYIVMNIVKKVYTQLMLDNLRDAKIKFEIATALLAGAENKDKAILVNFVAFSSYYLSNLHSKKNVNAIALIIGAKDFYMFSFKQSVMNSILVHHNYRILIEKVSENGSVIYFKYMNHNVIVVDENGTMDVNYWLLHKAVKDLL